MLNGWLFIENGQVLFVSDEQDLLEGVANYRHSPATKVPEFDAHPIRFGQILNAVRVTLFGAVL
jgi:hypothetical protein